MRNCFSLGRTKRCGCQRLWQGCARERVWGGVGRSHPGPPGCSRRCRLMGSVWLCWVRGQGTTLAARGAGDSGVAAASCELFWAEIRAQPIHSHPSTLSPAQPARCKGDGVFSGAHETDTSSPEDTHQPYRFGYAARSAHSLAYTDGWERNGLKTRGQNFF